MIGEGIVSGRFLGKGRMWILSRSPGKWLMWILGKFMGKWLGVDTCRVRGKVAVVARLEGQ
jgi:hypothetical protein